MPSIPRGCLANFALFSRGFLATHPSCSIEIACAFERSTPVAMTTRDVAKMSRIIEKRQANRELRFLRSAASNMFFDLLEETIAHCGYRADELDIGCYWP